MVKFVWLDVDQGDRVPVNPEQVKYLRQTNEGKTAVVFGAFAGGFNQVVVEQDAIEVVRLLEDRDDPLKPLAARQQEARSRAPKAAPRPKSDRRAM